MNDFMRPALYDVAHNIFPIIKNKKKMKGIIEFVGPICETTCKFIRYKKIPKVKTIRSCCYNGRWGIWIFFIFKL